MEQQADTSKIGMWLFLVTEVLLFGGLFVGFGMMQARYPQEFIEAHEHLQRPLGALNTIVNNLQSIRTLAVESANGSNSASDRAALNNQVQQQIAEITQPVTARAQTYFRPDGSITNW